MIKKILLIHIFLFSNFLSAQDWVEWHHSYTFELDTSNLIFDFVSIDCYTNDPHHDKLQNKNFTFNSSKNQYEITLNYGCISCYYGENLPDIYIKVNLKNWDKTFSTTIPIYFKNTENWDDAGFDKTVIGKIYLSDFVNGYSKDEKRNTLPPYEIIEISSDKVVNKLRKGEYELKRMDKVVDLELK